jgi:hypothetical protein
MAKKRLEDSFSEDEDPSGARGISRAEFKLRKQHYPSALHDKMSLKDILKYTPKQIKDHPHVNSLMKTDLSKLKKAGYNVNLDYFEKQDNTGKWNYYLKVLGDNDYFK